MTDKFRVVPVEATREMIQAADDIPTWGVGPASGRRYVAMLAASDPAMTQAVEGLVKALEVFAKVAEGSPGTPGGHVVRCLLFQDCETARSALSAFRQAMEGK